MAFRAAEAARICRVRKSRELCREEPRNQYRDHPPTMSPWLRVMLYLTTVRITEALLSDDYGPGRRTEITRVGTEVAFKSGDSC